jgi:hypothetical protein
MMVITEDIRKGFDFLKIPHQEIYTSLPSQTSSF